MPDNNYRPEGDPLGGSTQVPGTDDMAAVTPAGVTVVDGDETDDERDFVPPKGRLGATIALGVSQSIDNSEGGVSKTFFPQIMNAFGLSDAELGLLNALGNAARMIFGPVWAMLADRFGRKLILFIVTGLWGVWTLGAAFAQSWTMLLVLYGISLVGTVASEPILNGLLGSLYKRSERGKAFGTVRATASGLGFVLTPALGQFGGDPNGWRYAFITMGVLSIVSGILILIFVNEPKKVEKENADELKAEAGMFSLADAVKLFKIPTIALIAPMLLLVTSLVLFGFMGQVWARDMGFGVKNGSYLYTAFSIGATLSALLGGFLADAFVKKFGHKGRIMLFQIYAVLFGSIIAITMYFYKVWTPGIQSGDGQQVLQDPSIVYYVLVFLMGLVFSIGFSGCVLPMVSSVCPKQLSATSFAVLFSLIQGGINVVYSLVLGNVSKAIGSLPLTILLLVSIPYFINAIYFFVFYKTYEKDVHLQAERTALIEQGKF
ncbi:MFS transporter [Propioniciclava sp. MC1595]|uniref:MFS transporter n=1 Tax=Propioniciclava sp. MC1595 TaxID=2760308 RepID=UPI0016622B8E|nr:MFS transporter [Propioniciclava sp. MC1595]MBB1495402.1 MFS transporter [Propioniciclava sp. MC1595]QTE26574.1 MFS transporter [Propioniciclava sp. MC1595]